MQGLWRKYLLAVCIVLPPASSGWSVEFRVADGGSTQAIEDPYLLTPPSSVYPDPATLLDTAADDSHVASALEAAARSVATSSVATDDAAEFVSEPAPAGVPAAVDAAVDSVVTDGWTSDQWTDNQCSGQPWQPGCTECEDSCTSCSGGCPGGDCCPGLLLDFWVAQGFTGNTRSPNNNSNLPVTFNDRANEYQLNQVYVSLGRRVRECRSRWDIGGRVDLLYGTDYFFTTALGLETHQDGTPKWNSEDGPRTTAVGTGAAMYGLAMPQVYAEVFAPIGNGLRVKLGHFYTTLGYESVMAPENFFYSHAYAMQYGQPFTHTGGLAEFSLSRQLKGHFGYTRGWDTWEDPNDRASYLGGFTWAPTSAASISFAIISGKEDAAGRNNRTVYTLVYSRQIGCRGKYVMEHDFGTEANASVDDNFSTDSAKWYGINQYFLYDVTDKLSLGSRVEWFRDQDNARVLGIPLDSVVNGGNYFECTFGANWRPNKRWVVRPEIRWDWSDTRAPGLGLGGMYDDFNSDNQLTLAIDAIFRY